MISYQSVEFIQKDSDQLSRNIGEPYAEYHRRLSLQSSQIQVRNKHEIIFDVTIPPTVFHPLGGVAAQAFVSGILNGPINVRDKRVVDMGCGCGVIGLAAVIADSQSVLFTDINKHIVAIADHPLFRAGQDHVCVESLCSQEPDAAYDMVLFSIPSTVTESIPDYDSYETGIFRTSSLPQKIATDASRVLIKGGEFCFFYRIYDEYFLDWLAFHQQLSALFNIMTLKVLWHRREEKAHILLICIEK